MKNRLVATVLASALLLPATAFADTITANFEGPAYTLGNINGQQGWSKTGSYDVEVVNNTYGFSSFGPQSLRLSDAVTSGSFGDQTFSPGLLDEAGETDALNGGISGGTRQPRFEAQFDFASTKPGEQSGMHMSVSPDRGDGARMSYLRFDDRAGGVEVYFSDVQGTTNPATFVDTLIAILPRSTPHTIKFVMDFVDGPSNDVVKIYIDGSLVHVGTSWENYYRFDSESNPSLISNSRTVDSLLFREGGGANPLDAGYGFLVDNLSLFSGTVAADQTKEEVLDELQLLLPSLTKPNSDKVKSAIDHLTKSLNPKFWVDGTHLTKDGKPVFDEEKKAVHSLEEVVPRSLVIDAINSLVADDRLLATIAISESTKSAADITKANNEIAKGDTDAANSKFEEAIGHYKNAWDLAT